MSCKIKQCLKYKACLSYVYVLFIIFFFSGCNGYNWARESLYYSVAPRTIIIMPPRNLTSAVESGRFLTATLVKPLVDLGYYVFPVEATMAIFRQEGIDEGMALQISPARLCDYFAADAALYLDVESWDTLYAVLASDVRVIANYRLVSTKTGNLLWQNRGECHRSSHGHVSDNILASIITSTINAAITATTTQYFTLAQEATKNALSTLLPGYRHPDYERIQQEIMNWEKKQKKQR